MRETRCAWEVLSLEVPLWHFYRCVNKCFGTKSCWIYCSSPAIPPHPHTSWSTSFQSSIGFRSVDCAGFKVNSIHCHVPGAILRWWVLCDMAGCTAGKCPFTVAPNTASNIASKLRHSNSAQLALRCLTWAQKGLRTIAFPPQACKQGRICALYASLLSTCCNRICHVFFSLIAQLWWWCAHSAASEMSFCTILCFH